MIITIIVIPLQLSLIISYVPFLLKMLLYFAPSLYPLDLLAREYAVMFDQMAKNSTMVEKIQFELCEKAQLKDFLKSFDVKACLNLVKEFRSSLLDTSEERGTVALEGAIHMSFATINHF